jgi:hypothetical protein
MVAVEIAKLDETAIIKQEKAALKKPPFLFPDSVKA